MCPALLKDKDAVWVSVLQVGRGPHALVILGQHPRARVLPSLQASCVFRWLEHSTFGGSEMAFPSLDVSHTVLPPLPPHALPGLQDQRTPASVSEDPLCSFLS